MHPLRQIALTLLVSLCASLCVSVRAAPPPATVFFAQPDIMNAQLSPSGKKLAFTTSKGLVRTGLFVLNLDNPGKPQTAAYFPDADIAGAQWISEDRLIFGLTDLKQGIGRQEGRGSGLFVTSPDGSTLKQLIRRRAEKTEGSDRMVDRVLPANYTLLHTPYGPGAPADELIVGEVQWDEKGDVTRIVPHWLNVNTGLKRRLEITVPPRAQNWGFNPKGEPKLVTALRDAKRYILWKASAEADWRDIGDGDLIELPFNPEHIDADDQLFVTRTEDASGIKVLTRFNFKKNQPEPQALVRTPGFDFNGEFITSTESNTPLGINFTTDAEGTEWWDPAMKAFQAEVDTKIPGRINRIQCRRCGKSDMAALILSYSDREPGHLYLATEGGKQWQSLGRTRNNVDPSAMARVDFKRIQARDGRDLPVWLTYPKGYQTGTPIPAVVYVHGGPWVRGSEWGWHPMEQFLASLGYLVISPEFRGSKGYGDAHFRAGWRQWGAAMQDDVADALLWAQKEKLTDGRACIAGASYGGYSTLMSLIRHHDLYRCGIAWVAVSDPFLLLKGSSIVEDDASELSRRHSLPNMIGDPTKDEAMLLAASPLAQAHKLTKPLLMAVGESDVRVPMVHGTRMRDALEKAGNKPIWVSYPNEGHSWILPQTRLDFANRVERFLAEHLQKAQ